MQHIQLHIIPKVCVLCIFTVLCKLPAVGQELICDVNVVVTSKVQLSDKSMFVTLESGLREFINNKKWTGESYKPEERIEAVLVINISEQLSLTQFKAEITIQSSRPVFNSNYGTPIFRHVDKDFTFEYAEFQPFLFNENTFINNLTSVIAFYVYIIIGMDRESFSLKGGKVFFQKAQGIVNNAQGANDAGWKPHDDTRNRYWIIENLLNPNYAPVRDVYYKYHRNGLDIMYKEIQNGRKVVMNCLNSLVGVFEQYPNSMIMHLFFSAKSNELTGIFSKATPAEKSKAFNLLVKMDAANTNLYKKELK